MNLIPDSIQICCMLYRMGKDVAKDASVGHATIAMGNGITVRLAIDHCKKCRGPMVHSLALCFSDSSSDDSQSPGRNSPAKSDDTIPRLE